MKKYFLISFWLFVALGSATVVFNSCGKDEDPKKEETKPDDSDNTNKPSESLTSDNGVVINKVKWATRNVDAPGTFAAKPEASGKFYQYNRRVAWDAMGDVTGWNYIDSIGITSTTWEKANDPSPAGWRVPTLAEIKTLFEADKVTIERATVNGVIGRVFTDKETKKSLFLPASGRRSSGDGALSRAGEYGFYWSSTEGNDCFYVYMLRFGSDGGKDFTDWRSYERNYGHSVRPVVEN